MKILEKAPKASMTKIIVGWLLCLILLLTAALPAMADSGIRAADGGVSTGDITRMDLKKAWKYANGKGVNVAIIDGGADLYNSAIKSNIKGVYDAGTGSTKWKDVHDASASHGTNCAKIVLSVAPKANLYIIKAGSNGNIYTDQIIKGLQWAKTKKCRVISMSFGSDSFDQTEYDAINQLYTGTNSALVCASGGNSGKQKYHYPASYDNTLAVGAATYNSGKKSYVVIAKGTYNDKMDLVAPATSTSAAAPFAAGAAALLFQAKPSLTAKQCRSMLCDTAKDLGTKGKDQHYGYGLIQPYKAVLKAAKKTASSGSGSSKAITLSKTKLTLGLGKSSQLTYKNGGSKVTWSSSRSSVASVNSKGKITAKGCGAAVITAKASNGTKASCKVTVRPATMSATISNHSGKTSLSKALTVSWKRNTKVTGYQVQIATNLKFTQNLVAKTCKKNSIVSVKFSGLKKGNGYYMRIRAYKKSGSVTYYGAWASTSKAVSVL